MHWMLDATFNEDKSRIPIDNEPEDMAMLKKISLDILKLEKREEKRPPSFRTRRYAASLDEEYLEKVLIKNLVGFSYLFSSVDKHSGFSAWKLVFAYITGLVANCSSVNKIAEHCTKSPIIQEILGGFSLSQSALSRFFNREFDWQKTSLKSCNSYHLVKIPHLFKRCTPF